MCKVDKWEPCEVAGAPPGLVGQPSVPERGRLGFEPRRERALLLHLGAEFRMLLDDFWVPEEELVA